LRIVTERNAGKLPLTIQPIQQPGNDFATSDLSSAVSLDTGESFTFEVYFQPTTAGFRSSFLSLNSEAKQVDIILTGQGLLPDEVNNALGTNSTDQAYPNPFSESTTIGFTAETAGYASVSIMNALGTEVAWLFSGELAAGEHSFVWSKPTGLPDGMYECVVRMNGHVEALPVVLAH
jgi:hypothetical protein